MRTLKFRGICSLIVCVLSSVAGEAVATDEGIVKNANGDYVITYRSETSGQIIQWLWEPSTKIDPAVTWGLKLNAKSGSLVYSYSLTNGATSVQDLEVVRMVASSATPNTQSIPSGWHGLMVQDSGRSSGFIVSWSFLTDGGLKPGSNQGGFGFESYDIPGIGSVELTGSTPVPALKQIAPSDGPIDDGPSELSSVWKQFNDLHGNDFVPRIAAIPRIKVPSPFDAGIVIAGIKTHIDTDLTNLKLIDPILVSQLGLSLQAAIDAAKIGNITAVKSNLRDARQLLKEQVPDVDATYNFNSSPNKPKTRLIDPQAAWVLNFDLQYIERRL